MRIHSFRNYIPLSGDTGYLQLSITNAAAVAFTVPPTVNAAIIRIVGNASSTLSQPIAWYMTNGVTPTVGTGLPLYAGDVVTLYLDQVPNFKIIGADANAQIVATEFGKVS
jgi:hypothetical protein